MSAVNFQQTQPSGNLASILLWQPYVFEKKEITFRQSLYLLVIRGSEIMQVNFYNRGHHLELVPSISYKRSLNQQHILRLTLVQQFLSCICHYSYKWINCAALVINCNSFISVSMYQFSSQERSMNTCSNDMNAYEFETFETFSFCSRFFTSWTQI